MDKQDETFRILRRIPYEEMDEYLASLVTNTAMASPVYSFGNSMLLTKKHELVQHYERLKCLQKHGWTLEEFVLESEKRIILTAIYQFNQESIFPTELVDRAKEFFPNAKFVQAKIELE